MNVLEFIDTKIKQYEQFRSILYELIDIKHYSPNNMSVFATLSNISIRMDELRQIKEGLNNND